jgi:glucose/arabinose dehydrogenase
MKRVGLTVMTLALALIASAMAAAQTATPSPKPATAAKAAEPAAKLPPAILTAFQKTYPKATIKHSAKETENGKTTWEVESVENGLARDLVYNPDGTVVEIEEQIEPASLPAAVSAALKATYPKATITKAEKLTKGTTLTYEMALKGAAVTSIELTSAGKIVPAAKEAKDEKQDAPKKK